MIEVHGGQGRSACSELIAGILVLCWSAVCWKLLLLLLVIVCVLFCGSFEINWPKSCFNWEQNPNLPKLWNNAFEVLICIFVLIWCLFSLLLEGLVWMDFLWTGAKKSYFSYCSFSFSKVKFRIEALIWGNSSLTSLWSKWKYHGMFTNIKRTPCKIYASPSLWVECFLLVLVFFQKCDCQVIWSAEQTGAFRSFEIHK